MILQTEAAWHITFPLWFELSHCILNLLKLLSDHFMDFCLHDEQLSLFGLQVVTLSLEHEYFFGEGVIGFKKLLLLLF